MDFTAQLSDTSLKGKRIGVVTATGLTADHQVLWDAAAAALTKQGPLSSR